MLSQLLEITLPEVLKETPQDASREAVAEAVVDRLRSELEELRSAAPSVVRMPDLIAEPQRRTKSPGAFVDGGRPSYDDRFDVGDIVRHATFGPGEISEIEGTGDRTEATIEFSKVGEKRLLLAWSPLDLLEKASDDSDE